MSEILVTIKVTGESADSYIDTCDELIFEDFVGRHSNDDVELVRVEKIDVAK